MILRNYYSATYYFIQQFTCCKNVFLSTFTHFIQFKHCRRESSFYSHPFTKPPGLSLKYKLVPKWPKWNPSPCSWTLLYFILKLRTWYKIFLVGTQVLRWRKVCGGQNTFLGTEALHHGLSIQNSFVSHLHESKKKKQWPWNRTQVCRSSRSEEKKGLEAVFIKVQVTTPSQWSMKLPSPELPS